MNKNEFAANTKGNLHYKTLAYKELCKWKRLNNITGVYDIHHRDDTEETRKYNEEHYEFWGFNQDGTFEYGKYVVFLTHAEHASYHNTGCKHHQFGKPLTQEVKAKISAKVKGENHPNYGKHHCSETNAKNSETNKRNFKRYVEAYNVYKERGGTLKWCKFLSAIKSKDVILTDLII